MTDFTLGQSVTVVIVDKRCGGTDGTLETFLVPTVRLDPTIQHHVEAPGGGTRICADAIVGRYNIAEVQSYGKATLLVLRPFYRSNPSAYDSKVWVSSQRVGEPKSAP